MSELSSCLTEASDTELVPTQCAAAGCILSVGKAFDFVDSKKRPDISVG